MQIRYQTGLVVDWDKPWNYYMTCVHELSSSGPGPRTGQEGPRTKDQLAFKMTFSVTFRNQDDIQDDTQD